ncbi:MAG: c-type cytochrome [Bryobacteraceae bacterium]|nr:c-type cytochrome [Bryobacteraceae bacterium]
MYRCLFAVLIALLPAACNRQPAGPPYTPDQSLQMMKVEPGFKVEKLISEPAIVSPVAMDIDEDGRWWVVENRGYPLDTGKVGRVKLLEDTNNDGIPDKSTIFADSLVLPTGIMRWKKGVLVTDAPDLLYLEDTNGDGRADIRRPMLTGFAFTNPQHTVNSPVYGLDNWIYIAHENPTTAIIFKDKFSDRGSNIRYADRDGVPPLTEKGRNVRFNPDTGQLEALSGTSQFGHAFDSFGRHFTLNNTYHARHEVIAARYLNRNPDLPLRTALEDISDHGIPAKVFPLVARQRVEMLTSVGEFTSACGLTFFHGSLFVAEPAHNLVHRDLLEPKGATFVGKRTRANAEFIASTDPWFRPVNFYTGPNGDLYMLDYYRLVIEHPEWMATQTHTSAELSAGIDRGRIYKITSDQHPPTPHQKLNLSQATTAELVSFLDRDNPWWRRTAQRLLMDRKPSGAPALIAKLLAANDPVTRLHALWTLDGLGKLEQAHIDKALADPIPGIRENAIKLAEKKWGNEPALSAALTALAADPDSRVRFQLLATLGSIQTPQARAIRDRILFRDMDDRWVQVAALSAGSAEAVRLISTAKGNPQFFRQTAAVIGARRNPAEIQSAISQASRPVSSAIQAAILEGLAAGLRASAPIAAAQPKLLALFASPNAEVRRAALRLFEATGLNPASAKAAIDKAAKAAPDPNTPAALRADSIGLLALASPASHQSLFKDLINPKQPEAVQLAAARALGRIPGPETAMFLIANWTNMTGAVRMEAADAIYRDPSRIPLVLAALKQGSIQPWTLGFSHKRQLVMHRDPAIRDAARPLLEASGGERAGVIRQYQAALDLAADPARGRQVFEQVCRKCHQLNGDGAAVGPDLATVRSQPKQALLTDILNPSQAISQGFEAFVVETANSGTLDGVLGPQTATTITLRHEEGKEDVIQRRDIQSMRVTSLSAMPADLEKQISPQQMADLLEYLKRP